MRTPALFAIDPAARSGYAVLTIERSPRLLYFGVLDFKKSSHTASSLTREVLASCEAEHPNTLIERGVIEDQFMAVRKPKPGARDDKAKVIAQSAIKVARKAGRWEEAFSVHGIPFSYVHPQSWQSRELGKGSIKGRDLLKKQSVSKACGIFGLRSVSQDAADAILIGRYAAVQAAQKIGRGVRVAGV